MAIPKAKAPSELDADDWFDVRRTQITLLHRIEARREKNDLIVEARDRLARGEVLCLEAENVPGYQGE